MNPLPAKFTSHVLDPSLRPLNWMERSLYRNLKDVFQHNFGDFHSISICYPHVLVHPRLPDWIFKRARHNAQSFDDTHLYRVRKVQRLKRLAQKYDLPVVFPDKYLFYHKCWYVVAKKLTLHPFEDGKKLFLTHIKALALLCVEGHLEDIGKGNLHFSEDGKLILVDTEPYNRMWMKRYKWANFCVPFLKRTRRIFIILLNLKELEEFVRGPRAKEFIQNRQKQIVYRHQVKLASACALVCLGAHLIQSFLLSKDHSLQTPITIICRVYLLATALIACFSLTFYSKKST